MSSHVNVGTGIELFIAQLAWLIVKSVGCEGELVFDSSKQDGAMPKLINYGCFKIRYSRPTGNLWANRDLGLPIC